ncbi:acetyl-CoA acetyltransferase [Halioglobus maricola]|uniref:Acetyl-CoA acetyltransferase n=1 Tax=Halioglobus maricola TaxID=2601894 RepID=A0A5P9NMB0_9GAMM|nr:acetyl-CoA acetyltransferase [Halioglobus maricola]QFU76960.1 acetyl-CoA acetyltransferase [Halioglobus maricola]
MNPNTPVLVGVSAVQQKNADFNKAEEAIALMERAVRDAAQDAGSADLLTSADEILVPKGIWGYSDPARLVARAIGADRATTVLAEIGVSQQTLLTRACQRIADGEISVAVVVGGEAKYRSLCAAKAGAEAEETIQQDEEPDLSLHPEAEIWSEVESAAGLGMPVGYYAMMDSALRYKQGLTPDEHRAQMGAMYARFSEIAAENPDAWSDAPVTAEEIVEPGPGNRMLAFPYAKYHNSQWNVDQAAGLIFCNVATAERLGIPRSQWVFPRAFAEANFMSVVASRGDLGGCPGFRLSGRAAAARAGVDFDNIKLRELYSCFPLAVRSQLHEFGMSGEGDLSVTGAMPFGGGPLNNFVYQATVRMAQLLRQQPDETGLVTTVSSFLTKQGVALWSCDPGESDWGFDDVTAQVEAELDVREIVADVQSEATVAGYTVLYQGSNPWRGVAVFDLDDGRRTVAYSEDATLMARMEQEEVVGQVFTLVDNQFS